MEQKKPDRKEQREVGATAQRRNGPKFGGGGGI